MSVPCVTFYVHVLCDLERIPWCLVYPVFVFCSLTLYIRNQMDIRNINNFAELFDGNVAPRHIADYSQRTINFYGTY